ncbi:MAG: HAD hydrolase family protein [Bacteroidaceae bacterium]|nr:HAD hydrolase family protein [Bacteroidaceae bacterium]
MNNSEIDFSRVRALAFDVDGVLSANTILLPEVDDQPVRTANIKDGYALQLAVRRGLPLAIITGGKSKAVYQRYRNLGLRDVYQSVSMKLPVYEKWLAQYELRDEDVLYMGDDIPDYEIMERVGLACCPADAAEEIKQIADYVSPFDGGYGCVRDVVSRVLKAHGLWMGDKLAFGW